MGWLRKLNMDWLRALAGAIVLVSVACVPVAVYKAMDKARERVVSAAAGWQADMMQVVMVEQLCPGGPRSYRLVGTRDSLALEVQGPQRFYIGEMVTVHWRRP